MTTEELIAYMSLLAKTRPDYAPFQQVANELGELIRLRNLLRSSDTVGCAFDATEPLETTKELATLRAQNEALREVALEADYAVNHEASEGHILHDATRKALANAKKKGVI